MLKSVAGRSFENTKSLQSTGIKTSSPEKMSPANNLNESQGRKFINLHKGFTMDDSRETFSAFFSLTILSSERAKLREESAQQG